ncbi:unnamed protein product [Urochloa humidicola]
MASAAQIVLLDPMGIAERCEDSDTAIATASTSKGRQVKFWFKKVKLGGIMLLQLHASNLETPNPYGGGASNYFAEVLCNHMGLVLIWLSSPHVAFPTDYFVYGCYAGGNRGPWVVRLPKIVPEIHSCNSVGMLCTHNGQYVVANLRFQVKPQTWQVNAFLDCFYSSRNMVWSQMEVTPPFPDEEKEEHMCKWQTDLTIPFGDSGLLWVDLLRGILLCPNLLGSDYTKELVYVALPHELLSAWPEGDSRGRPQQFRNLSCINGQLKLVDLQSTNHNSLEVAIWTLEKDMQSWKKERSFNHCNVPAAPSFPVLSTDESDILYLTVAEENEARLLLIDTKTSTLKDSKGYPRFFNHRNPPYPSQLSKYLDNCSTKEILPTTVNYPSIYTVKEQKDNSVDGDSAPSLCPSTSSIFHFFPHYPRPGLGSVDSTCPVGRSQHSTSFSSSATTPLSRHHDLILDSGASHVVGDVSLLSSFTMITPSAHFLASDGRQLAIIGVGTVSLDGFHLTNVLFVPEFPAGVILVSVPRLAESGYFIGFSGAQCYVQDQSSDEILGKGSLHDEDHMYHLEYLNIPSDKTDSMAP